MLDDVLRVFLIIELTTDLGKLFHDTNLLTMLISDDNLFGAQIRNARVISTKWIYSDCLSFYTPPLMGEVLSEERLKKDNYWNDGNIPGGNFPGGNFPRGEFS